MDHKDCYKFPRELKTKLALYNHNKAIKAFGHLADSGAKKYTKELGSPGDRWYDLFGASERKLVAKNLTKHFETEYELGNYDYLG